MPESGNSEAVVLFDGVCNLCNASVNFIIDNDPAGYFKFASLQSSEAVKYISTCSHEIERNPEEEYDLMSSLILYENGTCYRQSTAALRIAKKLSAAWPLLYVLIAIPAPARDMMYRWVARNRYRWFGKLDACRLPSPELRGRFLDNLTT